MLFTDRRVLSEGWDAWGGVVGSSVANIGAANIRPRF